MSQSLLEFDAPEEMNGWQLQTAEPHRLIWASPSDYGVKVTLPKGAVSGLLPPRQIDGESGQPSLAVQKTIHPGTGDAQEAIDIAVSLLESHPIEVEDGVRDLPGVGDRTADYLALRHGVTTRSEVRQQLNRGDLGVIVQERFHEDLEQELKK